MWRSSYSITEVYVAHSMQRYFVLNTLDCALRDNSEVMHLDHRAQCIEKLAKQRKLLFSQIGDSSGWDSQFEVKKIEI